MGVQALPLTPRIRLGLAALGGLLWGTSLPHDLFPLLVLGGAVLLALAIEGDPWWDAARGTVFGFCYYGLSLTWFPPTWSAFMGQGGWGLWVGFAGAQTLVVALAAGLTGAAVRRGWPKALALGLAFAAIEELSQWVQPIPALPAILMVRASFLVWPAALLGRAALSGVVVAWGATCERSPRAAILALIGWIAVGTVWIYWSPPSGATTRIGVVQPGTGAFDQRRPSTNLPRAIKLREAVRQAGLDGAEWVATPEGALPLDPGDGPGARETAFALFWKGMPPTLLGASPVSEGGAHNALLAVEGGQITGRFHKKILVPMGERSFFGFGTSKYQTGTGPRVVTIAGVRVGPLICYEDLFGSALREAIADGAQVLVASTNDVWSGPGRAAEQHLSGARLAAIETGRWVVRPATSGVSAVINPFGMVLWEAPFVDGDLEPERPADRVVMTVPLESPGWTGAYASPAVSAIAALVLLGLIGRSR